MSEHSSRPFAREAADLAIDRAVREIMSREPRPGFRQRVLSRLDEGPRWIWSWPRLGLAAVAVVLVLMLPFWPRAERIVAPTVTAPRQAGPLVPIGSITEPAPPRREPREMRRSAPQPATERRVTAASVSPAEEAAEIDAPTARPPIEPITIAPLQVRPLQTPELVVRPVAIGPLTIVPVLPPR